MTEVLASLALIHGDYRAHGYRVEKYGPGEWLLRDPCGAQLMIASYGGLAPTKAAAMLEAYSRIASDAAAEALLVGHGVDR